jgi:hypothetical protein
LTACVSLIVERSWLLDVNIILYYFLLGDKSLILYDLIKMGDPIRIVENLTQKSIFSISFDNEDNLLTVSTEDYKILFYDLHSILNDDLSLKIDYKTDSKIDLLCQYMTKKTTILVMKYTTSNILLTLGRFDDNDPKIFM